MYGLQPSSKVRRPLDLRPLMELKSVVSMVKTVGSGVDVSYGRTYTTRGETKIATVPIGYADGYPRAFPTWEKCWCAAKGPGSSGGCVWIS